MDEALRMVHLRTVPDAWHARVLAARLGCEGIVTHLEGNLAGPYPFGAVRVLVEADQAELAAELLLADEVEAAFGAGMAGHPALPSAPGAPAGAGDDAGADAGTVGHLAQDLSLGAGAPRHPASVVRLRRAAAALVALAIAGAGALAHFF
jgi:hypothetical protein